VPCDALLQARQFHRGHGVSSRAAEHTSGQIFTVTTMRGLAIHMSTLLQSANCEPVFHSAAPVSCQFPSKCVKFTNS
jgi:hypothetical protein